MLDKSNDVGAHASIMVYTSALLGVVAASYRSLAMARRGVEATGRPFKSEPFIANCWLQGLSGAVLEVEAGRNDATSVRTFSLDISSQATLHSSCAATHTFMLTTTKAWIRSTDDDSLTD